jgi:predicted DNA binding CopG/RHH family protein
MEQIATFKPITTEQHEQFLTGTIRSVGRPKKAPSEKENIVAIRFSEVFLERLKAKAKANGFAAWQTYAKKVLAEDLEQPLERVQ